jgi:hypothetical protein
MPATALRVGVLFVGVGITAAQAEKCITTSAGVPYNDIYHSFYSGDGGPATTAQLGHPMGVSFDTSGGYYFADANNHRIRHVAADATGTINTIAGSQSYYGFSGDGGPATAALLNYPTDVAVDASGVYLVDSGNHRVRHVSAAGTIVTVAGNGVDGFGGDGGPASAASLSWPNDMALDGTGGYYIADKYNCRVRYVSAAGIISTVAGTGVCGYNGEGALATATQLFYPSGVAADGKGGFLVADAGNNRVRYVSPSGILTTVAGNGSLDPNTVDQGTGVPATAVQLTNPVSVAWDDNSGFYIASTRESHIRHVAGNGIVTFVEGGGANGDVTLLDPSGVTVREDGVVFISDTYNNAVRRVDLCPAGAPSTAPGASPASTPSPSSTPMPMVAARTTIRLGGITNLAFTQQGVQNAFKSSLLRLLGYDANSGVTINIVGHADASGASGSSNARRLYAANVHPTGRLQSLTASSRQLAEGEGAVQVTSEVWTLESRTPASAVASKLTDTKAALASDPNSDAANTFLGTIAFAANLPPAAMTVSIDSVAAGERAQPPSAPSSGLSGGALIGVAVGAAVGGIALVAVIVGAVMFSRRRAGRTSTVTSAA